MEGENNDSNKLVDVSEPLLNELEAPNINISIKEGNTSFFQTCFNGLNSITGIGILSVPYALASGGWLSLILLFIISMAATYTGLLVKRCMDVDPTIKSYPDIGEHAFGNIGKILVTLVLYADLYMVITGSLILEGDNLNNLFPDLTVELIGISIDGKSSFIIIVALIVLPTVWLDDLSILAYISAGGVVASFVILISVIWVGAFEGIGFETKGELFKLNGLPTAVSLFMFCYTAHPVFPPLYTSMHNKQQFSTVLLICFAVCTLGYAIMAILGYLMFGPELESQITLNLPKQKMGSHVAIFTTLVIPLAKYALMLKPVAMSLESWFPTYQNKKSFKIVLRTILVATQVIVALSVPFFGYLMSLVGALLSATASLTIPCLCYLKISGTKWGVEMVLILAILLLSVLIVIFGTYTSVLQILGEIMRS
ncbi:amino acid transporter AVT1I-like [Amaranthus tricolor]|uniref:amino acid transporter AVT1I-like n=1 Tax=Amaranthus tricolor TaxID=29722 RepID=UPI00258E089A|nr:amino acid transporter AVT1I-like [Amaranthus tricolor]